MSRYGKVAVLYGGQSSERAVSLKSGEAVLAALRARGIDAHGIDAGRDLAARLAEGYDRAFIALHGRLGEDGSVQGLLEVMGMPYTGSGVAASAVAMDKMLTKAVLRAASLPTPDFRLLRREEDLASVTALGLPLILKPVSEGSSIGVSKVVSPADLETAFRKAHAYGPVLAETCITGPEYTCAILGDRALPVIRLETARDFYDYDAKYVLDTTRYHCPCGLPAAEERAMQALALATFEALGARGWGRVDIMAGAGGAPYVLELNTVPGMTDHSLVPMAARHAGLGFEDLVLAILSETLEAP
ncbi:D-alanine--D-alanine ligase [Acidiferrobacter sp.]|uniref:D-alanine--D-alanine ligase n=1 Tax=Acidiferrobacter sp. TaxID=1872107 RepID=UPI0026056795|nr:D-alanine--D-alanine ligase [Acidiferrobacter sp.]